MEIETIRNMSAFNSFLHKNKFTLPEDMRIVHTRNYSQAEMSIGFRDIIVLDYWNKEGTYIRERGRLRGRLLAIYFRFQLVNIFS